MQGKSRETWLKIIVVGVVGLFALDYMVLSPTIAAWKKQSERLEALQQKVERGRRLVEREQSIRARWAEMQRTDLNDESSTAENDVFKALNRWARESRINFTSLTPQWRAHEDAGYDTFECRATATGDQAALGRLVYEIENDPLPAHVEDCEIAAKDSKGGQLTMALRFSFVRIAEGARSSR